jgi:MFS family permease
VRIALASPPHAEVTLGLRANAPQFTLLVIINAFVGAMVGLERTILPALAESEFHLVARSAILSFILVFGLTKAVTNYAAGQLSNQLGRKRLLVAGWLVAVPVPFLLMWAPTWAWVLVANALLGVSQGLTWSTTVIMKIDLVGAERRGLAMGLNEFAGYGAMGASAWATGWIASRYGLRPDPFYLGIIFVAAGLSLSWLFVRGTEGHVAHEMIASGSAAPAPSARDVFWRTSVADRNLSSVCQAGLVNNLNDTMAWGLFPLMFAAAGMDLRQIGALVATYPLTWSVAQLATGAWSDWIGRKPLIASGMWVQAVGIGVIAVAQNGWGFTIGIVLLGLGTAMVYPTLLAAIGDVASPASRASSIGVYRLWRDLGYPVGAVLTGVTADMLGVSVALWFVAALTACSGVIAAWRMTGRSSPRLRFALKGGAV